MRFDYRSERFKLVGRAMQGLLSSGRNLSAEDLAIMSVDYADAVLAEAQKKSRNPNVTEG